MRNSHSSGFHERARAGGGDGGKYIDDISAKHVDEEGGREEKEKEEESVAPTNYEEA